MISLRKKQLVSKTTLDIVRDSKEKMLVSPNISADRREHLTRLSKVTGRTHIITGELSVDTKMRLHEAGFLWLVGHEFVRKFKYAASVKNHGINRSPVYKCHDYASLDHYLYSGDIPDFALDRCEEAIKSGIEYLTIHSNEPFPVEIVNCDPVIIGWASNPCIAKSRNTLSGSQYGQWRTLSRHEEGVVVAVWDYDKEITIK